MRLKGKKALIIGAAGQGNMGQSIARRLVKEGAKVCVAGRNKAILKELAKELNGHYALSDITIRSDIETMVTEARSNLGKIDIAINATGWGLTKKFLNTNEEELDRMTAIQFKGPYFFMQSVISEMIKNGGGSIIQISSGKNKISTKSYNFKGLKQIQRVSVGKFYKYYYGNTSNYEEVKESLKIAISKGYTSAFIVAFKNGEKITIQEGIKKQ